MQQCQKMFCSGWTLREMQDSGVLPVKDVPHELEAGIVSLLGGLLVVVGAAGHQMRDQAVDGIRDSVALVVGHGCIVSSSLGIKVGPPVGTGWGAAMQFSLHPVCF